MNRLAVTLTVGCVILLGCSAMEARDPLQVTVASIEPLEQEGEALELRMLVKLRVQNPNSTPVSYDGAYVKVEVQDRTFATGVSEADGTIAGFGEALVEVPVRVSMFRMLHNVLAMSSDAPAEQLRYSMSGKLGSRRFKAAGEFSMKPPAPAAAESI
ncbi:MAG TPA: LEA type 2 family protein [Steroidobacteraceae bacterium]|nr:LEA type 2 family protein [Steroidobacteraceae bacterium]